MCVCVCACLFMCARLSPSLSLCSIAIIITLIYELQ